MTLLPNLFQENLLTGSVPMAFSPYMTAVPGGAVPFLNSVMPFNAPPVYTPAGQLVFTTPDSKKVPANTEIDFERFEEDLAALSPGHQFNPLSLFGVARNFGNGYVATYSAGLEHNFRDLKVSADYVATMGVHLPAVIYPNSFGGADPAFAPFTKFNAEGRVVGGVAQELLSCNRSHSTFHSLQASASKTSGRYGLGFSVNYTFSKSLDDTSSYMGPAVGGAGNVQLAIPQDPRNMGADKGPSSFDITHILVFNVIQLLPFDRVGFLKPLGSRLTSGWQFLNISTADFRIAVHHLLGYPAERISAPLVRTVPTRLGGPLFSTSRTVREDYFGRGADNTSFFSVPIGIPGGTGPNQGRLGTLGRDTFRGPAYNDFDVALIKETTFGRRGSAEAATPSIPCRVFQRVQPRQLWFAGKRRPRHRIWSYLKNRWNIPPASVLSEADHLRPWEREAPEQLRHRCSARDFTKRSRPCEAQRRKLHVEKS